MSTTNWQIRGERLQEIQAELRSLEGNIRERAIRAGLVSAVAPVKRTAKSLVPTDTGSLKRAIGHRSINKRQRARLGFREGEVGILVGTNRRVGGRFQGRKGMWQELGTENMQANPFLWPAMQQHQDRVEDLFYKGLSRYLERQRHKGTIQ